MQNLKEMTILQLSQMRNELEHQIDDQKELKHLGRDNPDKVKELKRDLKLVKKAIASRQISMF